MFFSQLDINLRNLDASHQRNLAKGLDYALHQWIWRLFTQEEHRDFLYRVQDSGMGLRVYILSPQAPNAQLITGIAGMQLKYKKFEPALNAGDRLCFEMTCSPRITRAGRKFDLLRDFYHNCSQPEVSPAQKRQEAELTAKSWLERAGVQNGFKILHFELMNRSRAALRHYGRRVCYEVLDMRGVIEIERPAPFVQKLCRGFGAERAFGCGLMLLRR